MADLLGGDRIEEHWRHHFTGITGAVGRGRTTGVVERYAVEQAVGGEHRCVGGELFNRRVIS